MNKSTAYSILEAAKEYLYRYSLENHIRLKRIELLLPIGDEILPCFVWLFYEKTSDIDSYGSDGTTRDIIGKFIQSCMDNGFPEEYIHKSSFEIDSEENVMENYSGSYFYRLRG